MDARQALLNKQAELQQRLDDVERDRHRQHSRDWADQAQERENDEVLDALAVETAVELKRVQTALIKIDNDDYGLCSTCGEEIGEKRLEALPETNMCIDCASQVH